MWIEASFPSEETLQIFLTFADEEGMDPGDLLAEWVNEALARMSNIDGAKERHAVFRSAVGVCSFSDHPTKTPKTTGTAGSCLGSGQTGILQTAVIL